MKTALNISLIGVALSLILTLTSFEVFGQLFGTIFSYTAFMSGRELTKNK